MKRVNVTVAIKAYKGEPPKLEVRPGYALTSSFHPGRKFALTKRNTFSGKVVGWMCVFQPEGFSHTGMYGATMREARETARTFLAAATREQLDEHVRSCNIRRAKQLLGE